MWLLLLLSLYPMPILLFIVGKCLADSPSLHNRMYNVNGGIPSLACLTQDPYLILVLLKRSVCLGYWTLRARVCAPSRICLADLSKATSCDFGALFFLTQRVQVPTYCNFHIHSPQRTQMRSSLRSKYIISYT